MKKKATSVQGQNTPLKAQPNKIHPSSGNNFPQWAAALLICLTGILIYSNSFTCSFHLDDEPNILFNSNIRSLANINKLWNDSHSRFLAFLTFALNYRFGAYEVWGYHLVNLLIHLANALAVWQLTRILFLTPALKSHPLATHKNMFGLAIGLLFVAHPLATQSVTYIVQRLASIAALFYFISLLLYVKGRLIQSTMKYLFFAGSFACLILALLSKENAYTLPFALILFEVCLFHPEKIKVNFKSFGFIASVLFTGLFIAYLFTTYGNTIFKPLAADFTNGYREITPMKYLLTQFTVLPKYIQLLILPIRQNLDYDYPLASSFAQWDVLLGFLFLAGLLIFSVVIFNKNRLLSLGIFFFFITMSIESGFIPISDLIFEHRTYLPSFGFFLIAGSVLFSLLKNQRARIAFFAGITLFYSLLTYSRNRVWQNDNTLWSDVIEKSPKKIRPYNCRGTYFYANNKLKDAINDYNKAVELGPGYVEAYYNRGNTYLKDNQIEEAIKDYTRAIERKPDFTEAYVNRGSSYLKQNNYGAAMKDFDAVLKINPKNKDAILSKIKLLISENKTELLGEQYNNLINLMPEDGGLYFDRGILLRDQNKSDSALINFNKAISLIPNNATYFFTRGCLFQNLMKNNEALADFSKAISLKSDYTEPYVNRANILRDQKKINEALADYKIAISINPQLELVYNNRGILYLNEGKFTEAVNDFTKAISLKAGYSNAFYNRGLANYKQGNKNQACSDWSQAEKLGHPAAGGLIRQVCQ